MFNLLTSLVEFKRKAERIKGMRDENVKSRVMALIYSCGIKPEVQFSRLNKVCKKVCNTLMIIDLGYTSVDKSLRTCERFDTSTYLQDHSHPEQISNEGGIRMRGGKFGLSFP